MKPDDTRQNVQLEQEAGNEALSAARTLVEKGLLRSAMSRAYYALFHYVKALPQELREIERFLQAVRKHLAG